MDIIDIAIAKSKATTIDPSDISSAVSSYLDEHNIENVSGVQIDGTSIVTDGVAEIPIGTDSKYGVLSAWNDRGIHSNDGRLQIVTATFGIAKNGTTSYMPITPYNQHYSAFYGFAKAAGYDEKNSALPVGTYSTEAKSAISDMLNGAVLVEGTTPTITALSGVRYICGEVATLDFTPCATGICDIFFVSGSTPTVVTLPNTVKFPNGEFVAEADTAYEINILDGIYGVVTAWT